MSTFGSSFSFSGGGATEKRQRAGTITETPASLSGGTGSIFGQTAPAAATGSVFGSTPAPAASASGLFGSTPAPAAPGGSMFGQVAPARAASTVGLFGSTQAPAASTGFGASSLSTTGAFGSASAAQPAQTSSLFGGAPAGPTSVGFFGSQPQQQQQPVPQMQPVQAPAQSSSEADELSKQLMLIKECWDPASPNHQFRHYFYNVAPPGQAHLYQCPAGQDPVLWQQALSDNPDPATLVPVLANGFDDLRKRVDSQSLQMQSYQERTSEISDKLYEVLQKHHSQTTVRLAECRRRQAELSQRLLEFMKLLQLLRLRGQLLHPEEELFRVRIEHLEKEMTRSGSLKQRLAELQDHTYRLQASARRRRELLGHAGGGIAGDGYEVADESQLESVMEVLGDKQKGLARMTQVVAQDAEAIEAIEGAIEDRFAEVQKQKEARERVQVARSLVQPW